MTGAATGGERQRQTESGGAGLEPDQQELAPEAEAEPEQALDANITAALASEPSESIGGARQFGVWKQ